jgi:hypothetical protein
MKKLMLMLIAGMMAVACTQNLYDTNVSIEAKFTATVQKYAAWKAAAPEEVRERWRETVDPLVFEGDVLMDSYHNVVKAGGDPAAIVAEIDLLITQILVRIAEAQ